MSLEISLISSMYFFDKKDNYLCRLCKWQDRLHMNTKKLSILIYSLTVPRQDTTNMLHGYFIPLIFQFILGQYWPFPGPKAFIGFLYIADIWSLFGHIEKAVLAW